MWYTRDPAVLMVTAIVIGIVGGFSLLLYSLFTHEDDQRSLRCLALNVYFEARGEPRAGQYAVAEVTMNRVTSPRYPNTVCAVVYEQRWDWLRKRRVAAFSWTEFDSMPMPSGENWTEAWQIAEDVYRGRHTPSVPGALFYHATRIKPSWADKHTPVARIGRHVFYR